MFKLATLLLCTACVLGHVKNEVETNLAPIIFVPGQDGNQIDAKFDKTYLPFIWGDFCPRKRDWHNVWLNIKTLFFEQRCEAENMKLVYNETTEISSNLRGVQIRVPYFGKTEGVEYIDPSNLAKSFGNLGAYAAPLFKILEEMGYKKNVDLTSAPYDFRRGAYRQISYDQDLKKLVERMYLNNNNKKILLLTHSLGGLMIHQFLEKQKRTWKRKHIRALVSMSTPWGGAVKAAEIFTSGKNFGVKAIHRMVIRKLYRTFESSTEAFPMPHAFGAHQPFIETPNKNYSISNMKEYFDDIEYPQGYVQYKSYSSHFSTWYGRKHPGVKTYIIYGTGFKTSERLVYGKDFPDGKPLKIVKGMGDGTVNQVSLRAPRTWSSSFNKAFYGFEEIVLKGVSHTTVLTAKGVLALIERINAQ